MLLLRWRKSPFLRTPAFTFWFALETPLWQSRKTLHQWKDGLTTTHTTDDWLRKRSACQTSLSMYPSIFNSFRVIRCLNQCISPNIAIFTTFLFPPGDAPGAVTLNVVWMERECDAYKLSRCMCPSKYNSPSIHPCLFLRKVKSEIWNIH